MALRIPFAAGLAAGYVLGTRAGRQRYESLARSFRSAKEQPAVQEAAGIVAARATELVSKAREAALGARSSAPGMQSGGVRTILSSPPRGQVSANQTP